MGQPGNSESNRAGVTGEAVAELYVGATAQPHYEKLLMGFGPSEFWLIHISH